MADAATAKPAETTTTTASAPAPKPAPVRALDRNFGPASYKYNSWAYDLEEPQTLEDVVNPAFWSTQASKVMGHDKTRPKGRGDTLEIRDLRNSVYAKFVILEIAGGYMKLGKIEAYTPVEVKLPEDAPLRIRWNKGKAAHEVLRKDDNEVLAAGFQSKQSAVDWAIAHLRQMAA